MSIYANLTQEQKDAKRERAKLRWKERLANETPEQREIRLVKKRKDGEQYRANDPERNKRYREARRLRDGEEAFKAYNRTCSNKNRKKYRYYGERRQFRIDRQEFENLLIAQNFSCQICKRKFVGGFEDRSINVDHNHQTDQRRGLLCSTCNGGLGMFKDSIDILKQAIEYISSY